MIASYRLEPHLAEATANEPETRFQSLGTVNDEAGLEGWVPELLNCCGLA